MFSGWSLLVTFPQHLLCEVGQASMTFSVISDLSDEKCLSTFQCWWKRSHGKWDIWGGGERIISKARTFPCVVQQGGGVGGNLGKKNTLFHTQGGKVGKGLHVCKFVNGVWGSSWFPQRALSSLWRNHTCWLWTRSSNSLVFWFPQGCSTTLAGWLYYLREAMI